MNKTYSVLMAFSLIALPGITLAKCKLPDTPSIPYGTLASETEMQSAKIAVNAFVADLNDYRSCIKKELASLGEPPSETAKAKWEKKHNSSVEVEEYIANAFNTQLRLFKSKQKEKNSSDQS